MGILYSCAYCDKLSPSICVGHFIFLIFRLKLFFQKIRKNGHFIIYQHINTYKIETLLHRTSNGPLISSKYVTITFFTIFECGVAVTLCVKQTYLMFYRRIYSWIHFYSSLYFFIVLCTLCRVRINLMVLILWIRFRMHCKVCWLIYDYHLIFMSSCESLN